MAPAFLPGTRRRTDSFIRPESEASRPTSQLRNLSVCDIAAVGLLVLLHQEVVAELEPPIEDPYEQLFFFSQVSFGHMLDVEDLRNADLADIYRHVLAAHVLLQGIEENALMHWAECDLIPKADTVAFFCWQKLMRGIE